MHSNAASSRPQPEPSLTLYFIPGRSWLPRWLLEELQQPYRLVRLDQTRGDHKQPPYLAINVLGKLPALDVDGKVMIETAAICLYLADRFGMGRLAPALQGRDRPRYLSLMVHASAALDPMLAERVQGRATPPEQMGWGTHEQEIHFVEGQLDAGPYLFGDTFTAADVMVGGMLIWGKLSGVALSPRLEDYVARLMQRPALMKLFEEVGGMPG